MGVIRSVEHVAQALQKSGDGLPGCNTNHGICCAQLLLYLLGQIARVPVRTVVRHREHELFIVADKCMGRVVDWTQTRDAG